MNGDRAYILHWCEKEALLRSCYIYFSIEDYEIIDEYILYFTWIPWDGTHSERDQLSDHDQWWVGVCA